MKKLDAFYKRINSQIVDSKGIANVVKVLKSGVLSKIEGDKNVRKFQDVMAKYLNQKYAFGTTSGTSSLHGALAAIGLGKDDEVLIPALTYVADASTVMQVGAKPVFVDICADNFNIDPDDVKRKITKNTKAIIITHLYGQPADMDRLMKISRENNLVVIEDCAQSIGALYNGKPIGSFGDLSCFSFYQTKNLSLGEGGLIATSSDKYALILKSVLNNGINRDDISSGDYDHIGFNYQMSEIQAALGVRQFERLKRLNKIRVENAQVYKDIFTGTEVGFQKEINKANNVYCFLACLLPERLRGRRGEFIKKLQEEQIPVRVQYPLSLPETTIVANTLGEENKILPVAKNVCERIFNLYTCPGVTKNEVKLFARTVKKVIESL